MGVPNPDNAGGYVGWRCGDCGKPVAGKYSICEHCGYNPFDRLKEHQSASEVPANIADMKVTRETVYSAIDGERDYQDAQRGNAKRHEDQPPMTPGELILCMEECLAQARAAWYKPDGGTACLPYIRKVTALGVQCMERHGAPLREMPES